MYVPTSAAAAPAVAAVTCAVVIVPTLPELPVTEMLHVPVAPVPEFEGTPRFVLAVAASDAPVPPSDTAKSVIPEIEPPVIETALEFCVAIVPNPKLVRAAGAADAPVPPLATGTALTRPSVASSCPLEFRLFASCDKLKACVMFVLYAAPILAKVCWLSNVKLLLNAVTKLYPELVAV